MSTVAFERRGAVAVLSIQRPKALNALDSAVLADLGSALDQIGEARAVVLTGAGDRAFVAGADIAEMQALTPEEARTLSGQGQALFSRLEALAVPTIAAVNGFALGGGCELTLACDLVLAAPNARFGQPEVKLGVIAGFGGTQRLVRRVGAMRAQDLLFTGRMVKAEEAVAIGLALRIADPVLDAAVALGEEIAAQGPLAVAYTKRAVSVVGDVSLREGLLVERDLFALCFESADQKEGMRAFLGKRAPRFTGA